jgi:hypothetical protein
MPLYKITSKRLARKEREDASGLTELKAKIFEELGEDDGSSGSGSGSDSEGSSGSDEDEDEDEESGSGSGSEGSEGTVDSEGEWFAVEWVWSWGDPSELRRDVSCRVVSCEGARCRPWDEECAKEE